MKFLSWAKVTLSFSMVRVGLALSGELDQEPIERRCKIQGMRSTCNIHGLQIFTPKNPNGDTFCTACVAEFHRKLGGAIWDDLHWRKYAKTTLAKPSYTVRAEE